MPRRVLVVDDEPVFGNVIRRALCAKYEVCFVCDARQALAMLEAEGPFDAIVSDVVMAPLSGVELFNAICERWPDEADRVLLYTAGPMTPEQEALVSRMRQRCLLKPFEIDELAQAIDVVATLPPVIRRS